MLYSPSSNTFVPEKVPACLRVVLNPLATLTKNFPCFVLALLIVTLPASLSIIGTRRMTLPSGMSYDELVLCVSSPPKTLVREPFV